MKALTRRTNRTIYRPLTLVPLLAALVSGCALRGHGSADNEARTNRTAPEHTQVRLKPSADRDDRFIMTQAAQKVTCNHPLGCSCTLDGFATSCSFVFDCIDAGFCECVAGCDNLDP